MVKKLFKRDRDFVDFLCLVAIFLFLVQFNTGMIGSKKPSVLQASTGTNQVRFYYDAGGQRVAKLNPLGNNTYYISPNVEVVYNKDGTVSWRKNYYFNGKAVAVRNGTSSTSPSNQPTSTPTVTLTPTPRVSSPTSIPTSTSTPTPSPRPSNSVPVIVTTAIAAGVENSGYSTSVSATDVNYYDNLTMTFSNLPSEFITSCVQTVSNNVKTITCNIISQNPTPTSRYITVTVSDGVASASRQYLLRIRSGEE